MKFAGCHNQMILNGDQFTWCDWSDARSTQSFFHSNHTLRIPSPLARLEQRPLDSYPRLRHFLLDRKLVAELAVISTYVSASRFLDSTRAEDYSAPSSI